MEERESRVLAIPELARILIIDDESLVRDTMRLVLEDEGHEVIEAANGQVALELDTARPADLIITDLIMPEADGIATIARLRKARPDVKIIALSGGGRLKADDPLRLARQLGAVRTLAKPLGPVELIQAVQTCLA